MIYFSDEVYDDGISLNYILLSVTYYFGLGKWAKLKETTGNNSALGHLQSIGVCTREHSESVKQHPRIVRASLISSLEVAIYDYLPHRFS